MNFLPQIVFISALGVASYFISRRVGRIGANIRLGRAIDRFDQPGKRWQSMLLIAFGQKKMFDKPLIGFLHFLIYAGFLLINIEVLEIVLDGVLGTHRVFAGLLPSSFYAFLIGFFEFLALGVMVSCVVFLIRRNILKVPRFWKPEMKGWPFLDANLILIIEIVLMVLILSMNASDQVLQGRDFEGNHYTKTGIFAFSGLLVPFFSAIENNSVLIFMERFGWWAHILGIMAFALYVTYSKHLHIALAFPNTYFSNLKPKGAFENMPSVTKEVKLALGLIEDDGSADESGKFGVKDVNDLTWKNLMDAYSCTECGRCTASCPANITGKKLSPRKVMMDTRDRLEEVGQYISQGKTIEEAIAEGESLYSDRYISKEELMACTTCNACVDACPVNIDPLSIIMQMRQYIAMEEADAPASWNMMFSNVENNLAPWQFPPSDRANWAEDLSK
ncbi:MAG: (Fe-S)-binding protein [Microscillaceae bacterium]|nr:(Fe-S)-binding protein [Microscillaceae bacterium]